MRGCSPAERIFHLLLCLSLSVPACEEGANRELQEDAAGDILDDEGQRENRGAIALKESAGEERENMRESM